MSNKGSEFRRIWLSAAAATALAACQSTPQTVLVDANTRDQTAASAFWMQADIPGTPLSNVFLRGSQGSSNISVEVGPTTVATITALATDNESGVQRLELFGLVTIKRIGGAGGWFTLKDHVSNNFGGVTNTPVPGQCLSPQE